jgi:D-alanine-D-alanine ligase
MTYLDKIKDQSIGIIYGGLSPEHDISILTALQVERLLTDAGVSTQMIYWTKFNTFLQVPNGLEAKDYLEPEIKGSKELQIVLGGEASGLYIGKKLNSKNQLSIDVVLNCCHGGPGEEGELFGALAIAQIPVSGASKTSSASISMDKLATHSVAKASGVPVAENFLVTKEMLEGTEKAPFEGPYILKPRFGGSSIGIEIVDDFETLCSLVKSAPAFKRGAVADKYLNDWHDLNIACVTYPEVEVSFIEKPTKSDDAKMWDYNNKYLGGADGMENAQRELPAVLPKGIEEKIKQYAKRVAQAMDLTGIARIDFLWDGKSDGTKECQGPDTGLIFVEANVPPGSLSLYLWEATGFDRAEILARLVSEAIEIQPAKIWDSSFADGLALRNAGSIASKLY